MTQNIPHKKWRYYCSRAPGRVLVFFGVITLQEMGHLQELVIKKAMYVSSEAIEAVFSDGKLNKLRKLNLSECTQLKDEAVAAITKWYGIQYMLQFL